MTKPTLAQLQKKVVAFRDARDWKQFHNPKDMAISLALEAAEVMEHFQWKSAEDMENHIMDKKEDVADEIADVLYWVLLMSNDFGIDIATAFEKKLKKNDAKYPVAKAKGRYTKYTEL